MTLHPRVNRAIDVVGLIVALVVDLVLNFICFAVLAPDLLTRIAFVSIGVMIVLFVLRSWSKRQYLLYVVFVAVVFFFDYSFVLEATRAQSHAVTAETDTELSRITAERTTEQATLADLRAQYGAAMKRETMDQLDQQMRVSQARIDRYDGEYATRFRDIERGAVTVKLTANNIFLAIPTAFTDQRYIPIVIYALIFAGLQGIVASSVDNKRLIITATAQESAPVVVNNTPRITQDDIIRFVRWSWYRITQKTSDNIMPREVFFDLVAKQGGKFDAEVYDYLIAAARSVNLIDATGRATEREAQKAIEILGDKLKAVMA